VSNPVITVVIFVEILSKLMSNMVITVELLWDFVENAAVQPGHHYGIIVALKNATILQIVVPLR